MGPLGPHSQGFSYAILLISYRGVGVTRTMEIGKKPVRITPIVRITPTVDKIEFL